jgi:hypothetical protein
MYTSGPFGAGGAAALALGRGSADALAEGDVARGSFDLLALSRQAKGCVMTATATATKLLRNMSRMARRYRKEKALGTNTKWTDARRTHVPVSEA